MAELCACDGGLSSLNRKRDCRDFLKKAVHVMPIARQANGVKNFIDLATIPVPEAVFEGMFRAPAKERLHIIYDIKNTAFETQDGATEDWADGTSSKLRDGHLQMTFVVPETDLGFIGNSQDLECRNPDLYLYLADGTIVGYGDRDTIGSDKKLYPLPVDRWEVVKTPLTTDDGVAKVEITVHFSNTMSYKKWIVLKADQHQFDETENYEAVEANMILGSTATTTTAIEVEVTMDGYDILGNKVPVTGLELTDFIVKVNGTPDNLSAISETNGIYTLTFSAPQSSTDVVTVELAPSAGYLADVVTDVIP